MRHTVASPAGLAASQPTVEVDAAGFAALQAAVPLLGNRRRGRQVASGHAVHGRHLACEAVGKAAVAICTVRSMPVVRAMHVVHVVRAVPQRVAVLQRRAAGQRGLWRQAARARHAGQGMLPGIAHCGREEAWQGRLGR